MSKIADATLIESSARRNNEKIESLSDEVLEVEEEWLKSSLRRDVASFRWCSNAFSSKSTTNEGLFEAINPVSLEIES